MLLRTTQKEEKEDDSKHVVQCVKQTLEEEVASEAKHEARQKLSRTPAFDLEGPQPSTTATKLEPESSPNTECADGGFQGSQSDPLGFCKVFRSFQNQK